MRGCSLLAVHQNLILIAECSDFTQTSALLTVLISLLNAVLIISLTLSFRTSAVSFPTQLLLCVKKCLKKKTGSGQVL